MNQKKIGEFIANLRREQDMTQEDLASILYINRESVSKWERGVNIPDPDRLIKLSKIFNVSINEILNGERITQENKEEIERIPLRILEYKDKQIMHLKILILFIIVISIGAYLMKSYYSHVSIYNLVYDNDKYNFSGMLVNTTNFDYLYLESINSLNEEIDKIEIYSGDEIKYISKEKIDKSNIWISAFEKNIDKADTKIRLIKQDGAYDEFILNYHLVNDNRYIFKIIIEAFINRDKNENNNLNYSDINVAKNIEIPQDAFNINGAEIFENTQQYRYITIEDEESIDIKYYYNEGYIEIINDNLVMYSILEEKCLYGDCNSQMDLINKAKSTIYN